MNIPELNEHGNVAFATASTIVGAISQFYEHLAPWLLLGLVLVLVDLRFGMAAARVRGEPIRPSRACRRTVNKIIDYLCWVTVAEVMSRTFGVNLGVPIVSLSTLFLVYGIEINSCVNNYLEYKGVTSKRFNIFKFLSRKQVIDAEDMMEDNITEQKQK